MQRIVGWMLAALLAAAIGCNGTTMIDVEVESTVHTNEGLPFYVVVQSTDQQRYLTESYDEVADKLFKKPAEPTVLATEVIVPGEDLDFEFPMPEDENTLLGVYFMFTKPKESWKVMVDKPLPESLDFELDDAGNIEWD